MPRKELTAGIWQRDSSFVFANRMRVAFVGSDRRCRPLYTLVPGAGTDCSPIPCHLPHPRIHQHLPRPWHATVNNVTPRVRVMWPPMSSERLSLTAPLMLSLPLDLSTPEQLQR